MTNPIENPIHEYNPMHDQNCAVCEGYIVRERMRQISLGYTADSDDRKSHELLNEIADNYQDGGNHLKAAALRRAADESERRALYRYLLSTGMSDYEARGTAWPDL